MRRSSAPTSSSVSMLRWVRASILSKSRIRSAKSRRTTSLHLISGRAFILRCNSGGTVRVILGMDSIMCAHIIKLSERGPRAPLRLRPPRGENPLPHVASPEPSERGRRSPIRGTPAPVLGLFGHTALAGLRPPPCDESDLAPGRRAQPARAAGPVDGRAPGLGRVDVGPARRGPLGSGIWPFAARDWRPAEYPPHGNLLGIRRLGLPVGVLAVPDPSRDRDGPPGPLPRS